MHMKTNLDLRNGTTAKSQATFREQQASPSLSMVTCRTNAPKKKTG